MCRVCLDEDPAVVHYMKADDLVCIEEDAGMYQIVPKTLLHTYSHFFCIYFFVHTDGEYEIQVEDRVEISVFKAIKNPVVGGPRRPGARGTVASVEKHKLYRIQYQDGYSGMCRRSDVCTLAEWKNRRPTGAKVDLFFLSFSFCDFLGLFILVDLCLLVDFFL